MSGCPKGVREGAQWLNAGWEKCGCPGFGAGLGGWMLERLRCGVIVTDRFKDWLGEWRAREGAANFGFVAELSYVRCVEGARAGQAWASVVWRPLVGIREHEIFVIGEVKVYLSRQTRTALRERCVDVKDGVVTVI